MSAYPEVLAHLEEPQCSATALPIYRLYQACRAAGLTVILTGEGADELLGGYHWFRGDAQAQRLLWLPGPAARPAGGQPAAHLGGGAARAAQRRAQPGAALCPVAGRWCRSRRPAVARRWRRRPTRWRVAAHAFTRPAGAGATPFRQFQYVEAHTRLVDFINFEVDRMSMAHSIEARVPFLDHELWEYAAQAAGAALLLAGQPKDLLRRRDAASCCRPASWRAASRGWPRRTRPGCGAHACLTGPKTRWRCGRSGAHGLLSAGRRAAPARRAPAGRRRPRAAIDGRAEHAAVARAVSGAVLLTAPVIPRSCPPAARRRRRSPR